MSKKDDAMQVMNREYTDAMTKLKDSINAYTKDNLVGKDLTPQVVLDAVEFLKGGVKQFCKNLKIAPTLWCFGHPNFLSPPFRKFSEKYEGWIIVP